jgi:ABC-type Fe3+ transport system permease subunit
LVGLCIVMAGCATVRQQDLDAWVGQPIAVLERSFSYGTIIPLIQALIIKEPPIGVQLMRNGLAQVSVELEEAAIMSGVGFAVMFRRITLPLVMPMIVSVFLLVFAGAARDIAPSSCSQRQARARCRC